MTPTSGKQENPRTSRVRRVVIDSALGLLLNHGANEVTATRISNETGVARTTIYRHWPDQASLVLSTIETLVQQHRATPSTGNLSNDLTTSLLQLRTRLVERQVRHVFAALVDYASRDDAFIIAQRTFIEGLTKPTHEVLRNAQQAGNTPSDLDNSIAAASLAGPLLYQFLVMREDIPDELINAAVSSFTTSLRV